MATDFAAVAHPRSVTAPVAGGRVLLVVRPWSMAARAELKPLLVALLDRLSKLPEGASAFDLATLFAHAEDEVAAIVRATVQRELAAAGVSWDDLDWEDLLILAQAVWETSVVRPDGGGLGGKVVRAVFGLLSRVPPAATSAPSPLPSEPNGKRAASPSSPVGGEPIRSPSATG